MTLIRLEIIQENKKDVRKHIYEVKTDMNITDKNLIEWISLKFKFFFEISLFQGKRIQLIPKLKFVVSFNNKIKKFGIKRITKDSLKILLPIPLSTYKFEYYIFKEENLIISNLKNNTSLKKLVIENRLEKYFNSVEYQKIFEFKNFNIEKSNPFRN